MQSEGLTASNHPSWKLRETLNGEIALKPLSTKKVRSSAVAPPVAKFTPCRKLWFAANDGGRRGSPSAAAAYLDCIRRRCSVYIIWMNIEEAAEVIGLWKTYR